MSGTNWDPTTPIAGPADYPNAYVPVRVVNPTAPTNGFLDQLKQLTLQSLISAATETLTANVATNTSAITAANSALATGTVSALVGGRVYATQAALRADLSPADKAFALVYADPVALYNDLYVKAGAPGTGTWTSPLGVFASAASGYAATAAGFATTAAASQNQVTAARDQAGTFAALAGSRADDALAHAAVAGQYDAAVRVALGQLPTNSKLRLQAASIGILAGFRVADLTAGTQAYLSDKWRYGDFEWQAIDMSALVAADPYQAIYVAPAEQPSGSQGAWRRNHDGDARLGWAGVRPDGVTDWQAQINWLVKHPELSHVRAAPGSYCFSRSVVKKSGMTFEGVPGATIMRAKNFTGFAGGDGSGARAWTTDPLGTTGCRDIGFILDIAKTGALDGNTPGTQDQQQRVHGVSPFQANDYVCENVQVLGCTGYAFVAFGGLRGRFVRTHSINAHIPLEFSNADEWTSTDHVTEAGDGDIITQAMVHWVNGTCRTVVRGYIGSAAYAVNGAYALNDSPANKDMIGNRLESSRITVGSASPGINVENIKAARNELTVTGSYIETHGVGTRISSSDPNGFSKLRTENGETVAGSDPQNAVAYVAIGKCLLEIIEPTITLGQGLPAGSQASLWGLNDNVPQIRLVGGTFTGKANGENRIQPDYPVMTVRGNPDLRGMPTPTLELIGVGHKRTLSLAMDSTGNYHRAMGARLPIKSVIEAQITGTVSSDRGVALAMDLLDSANISSFNGRGYLQTSADDHTDPASTTLRSVGDGFSDGSGATWKGGNYVRANDTSPHNAAHAFELKGRIVTLGSGPGDNVELFLLAAPTTGYGDYSAGTCTVQAGAAMTLEWAA